MGMSVFYGVYDDSILIKMLYYVLDQGVILFDIVDMYGFYINERLVGRVIVDCCDWVFLVMKFGIVFDFVNFMVCGVNGRLEYVCCSCE